MRQQQRLLLLVLFFIFNMPWSLAEPLAEPLAMPLAVPLNPDWHWRYSKGAIGAEYFSNLSRYGATFYDSFQVVPVWSLALFNPNFEIVGTSPRIKWHLHKNVLVRSHFALGGPGDKPLYETGTAISPSSDRESTMSWAQFIELGDKQIGEISLQWEQDLKEHHGAYFELAGRWVLYNLPYKRYQLQPALFATLGAGSADFNQYIYGVGAADELQFNNYSVGLQLNAPPAFDHLYPLLRLQYYSVIGGQNRRASLVATQVDGFQAMLTVAFKVFETGVATNPLMSK